MSRRAAWVGLAAVAAVVLGCGPGKELPEDIKINDPDEKPITVPVASEPAAKEYVARAVKAYAGGKPELVARGKVSRVVFKGTMMLPADNQMRPFSATRTMAAVWHDRIYVNNDLNISGQPLQVRTWLRGPDLTALPEPDQDNRADLRRSFPADVTGQYWMGLFVPLADPKAVVFDLQTANTFFAHSGQTQEVRQLKLALPELPLYQLTFDAKTDRLLRTDYTTKQGVRRRTQWTAMEHKAGPDGLQLPSRTECRHDGVVVEQWEVEKWEFPEKIDDAEFLPPKADANPPKK